jgi:hypothetical protein
MIEGEKYYKMFNKLYKLIFEFIRVKSYVYNSSFF